MNMKLRAIALIALMSVLTFAANAQATRANLPAPDNFLGIATFPLWDGDAPGALGKEQGVPGYCGLMKVAPEKCKSFEQNSPDSRVSAQTPPTFLYHTTDDELAPVDASVTFYRTLRAAGVPAEMHIFAKGKHGSGLGLGDAALDLWPTLLEAWLRGLGLLTPDPAIAAAHKPPAPPAPRKPGAPFSVDHQLQNRRPDFGILVRHEVGSITVRRA